MWERILLLEQVANVWKKWRHKGSTDQGDIRAHPVNNQIVQLYMPTSAHEEEKVDGIYEILEDKLENIEGKDYVIVMGTWKPRKIYRII